MRNCVLDEERWTGNWFRRVAVLGVIAVVVVGGAWTAYAAISSGSAAVYRLGTVTPSEVTAALHEVGTLNPVQQAYVPFAVSGTVRSVAVQPGQHVSAGQKLGSLDPTALQAQLTAAQSTLASANLQVHNDEASQSAAASNSAQPSGSASSTSGPSGSSHPSSPSAPTVSSLRPLQQAVVAAQHRVDGLLTQAKAALTQATQACTQPPGPSPSPTPTPSTPVPPSSPAPTATPTPSASPSATPSASGSATPTGAGPATLEAAADGPSPSPAPSASPPSCAVAEQRVLSLETAVLRAQQALSRRLTALGSALARAAGTSGGGQGGPSDAGDPGGGGDPSTASDPGGGGDPSTASDPGGGGDPSGGVTRGGGGSGPVTADQLAADQAAADAAAAQVTVAQQNLAAATVVSPVSGTVTAVDVTTGASASAGSTAFVIAGLDSYDVVASVPVTDMPALKVGERASVLPDGTSTPVSGTVVSIGLVPDSTGSSTTYPVTIGLTGQPPGLHSGGYASVTITTARSSGVSVPHAPRSTGPAVPPRSPCTRRAKPASPRSRSAPWAR